MSHLLQPLKSPNLRFWGRLDARGILRAACSELSVFSSLRLQVQGFERDRNDVHETFGPGVGDIVYCESPRS